jgi:hypothetical protein
MLAGGANREMKQTKKMMMKLIALRPPTFSLTETKLFETIGRRQALSRL